MPATKTRDTRRKVVPTEGEVQELFQRVGICVDGTSPSSVETRGSHELSDHKPDSAYDYVLTWGSSSTAIPGGSY